MTRILIVETASPKRIVHKVEQIRNAGLYPESEIDILCQPGTRQAYAGLPDVKIWATASGGKHRFPKELIRKRFDIVFAFWTGEKKYRWMKFRSLRINAGKTFITAGDGNEFRLTWKAICRHTTFRLKHPLPADHYGFVMPAEPREALEKGERYDETAYHAGEQILVIQSAEPVFVLKALERLHNWSPFHNPLYTLFCRNRPEILRSFQNHPMLHKVWVHSETRESGKHLRNLREQGFDAIVLFMTGDPSYRKIKIFAFLLGVPLNRILVFNETIDCFFFNWSQWFGLVSRRMREKPNSRASMERLHYMAAPASSATKIVLFPFRFLWLLLVWVRLRLSGIKSSRKNHDYSLQLPPFPGA
jgi:hypothetical protein